MQEVLCSLVLFSVLFRVRGRNVVGYVLRWHVRWDGELKGEEFQLVKQAGASCGGLGDVYMCSSAIRMLYVCVVCAIYFGGDKQLYNGIVSCCILKKVFVLEHEV